MGFWKSLENMVTNFQDNRTERMDDRQDAVQGVIDAVSEHSDNRAEQRRAYMEMIGENPEILQAGASIATGGIGSGLSSLLGGLFGGSATTTTTTASPAPADNGRTLLLIGSAVGGGLLLSKLME